MEGVFWVKRFSKMNYTDLGAFKTFVASTLKPFVQAHMGFLPWNTATFLNETVISLSSPIWLTSSRKP